MGIVDLLGVELADDSVIGTDDLSPEHRRVSTVRVSTMRVSTVRVSTMRVSTVRVSRVRVSRVRVSRVRVSTMRVSTVRVSTMRVSTMRVSTVNGLSSIKCINKVSDVSDSPCCVYRRWYC